LRLANCGAMIATNSASNARSSEGDADWIEDVFAALRDAIGGPVEQDGRARDYGAGRFSYAIESDGIALTIEIRDDFLRRRRDFAPIDWHAYEPARVAALLVGRYREMLGTGRAPQAGGLGNGTVSERSKTFFQLLPQTIHVSEVSPVT